MKNTIVVLMVLLANMPVFAQFERAKTTGLINIFHSEKKSWIFILNNKQDDSKRFMELYNQYHTAGKKTDVRPSTYMNAPPVFSVPLPVGISRNVNTPYQRYAAGIQQPSPALQLFGLFGGIAASVFYPKQYRGENLPFYTGNTDRFLYLNKNAAVDAYLESTYRQHNW